MCKTVGNYIWPLVGCWLGHTSRMGLLSVAHPESVKVGVQLLVPALATQMGKFLSLFWEPTERPERLCTVYVLTLDVHADLWSCVLSKITQNVDKLCEAQQAHPLTIM